LEELIFKDEADTLRRKEVESILAWPLGARSLGPPWTMTTRQETRSNIFLIFYTQSFSITKKLYIKLLFDVSMSFSASAEIKIYRRL